MNKRVLKLYYPDQRTEEFETGRDDVQKIWVSHDAKDLFVRVTTSEYSTIFKGIPYSMVEFTDNDQYL